MGECTSDECENRLCRTQVSEIAFYLLLLLFLLLLLPSSLSLYTLTYLFIISLLYPSHTGIMESRSRLELHRPCFTST